MTATMIHTRYFSRPFLAPTHSRPVDDLAAYRTDPDLDPVRCLTCREVFYRFDAGDVCPTCQNAAAPPDDFESLSAWDKYADPTELPLEQSEYKGSPVLVWPHVKVGKGRTRFPLTIGLSKARGLVTYHADVLHYARTEGRDLAFPSNPENVQAETRPHHDGYFQLPLCKGYTFGFGLMKAVLFSQYVEQIRAFVAAHDDGAQHDAPPSEPEPSSPEPVAPSAPAPDESPAPQPVDRKHLSDTTITRAWLEVSWSDVPRGTGRIQITGILPRCRKPKILSESKSGDTVHLDPLYGHNGSDAITLADWQAWVDTLPVKAAKWTGEGLAITPEIAQHARDFAAYRRGALPEPTPAAPGMLLLPARAESVVEAERQQCRRTYATGRAAGQHTMGGAIIALPAPTQDAAPIPSTAEQDARTHDGDESERRKALSLCQGCSAFTAVDAGEDGAYTCETCQQEADIATMQGSDEVPPCPVASQPDPAKIEAYQAKRAARVARLHARAAKVKGESNSRLTRARRMADIIPFGQPIMIGHHSEQRDRRYRGKIEFNFHKGFELMDRAEELERRAKVAEQERSISSDDPAAISKLQDKMAALKEAHAKELAANQAWRTMDEAQRIAFLRDKCGYCDANIAYMKHHRRVFNVGYTTQEIRRCEDRIAELKRLASLPHVEQELDGVRMVEDPDANRLQLYFDDKPDQATIARLKANGFHWSPSLKCWQRQLNNGARYAAQQVCQQG